MEKKLVDSKFTVRQDGAISLKSHVFKVLGVKTNFTQFEINLYDIDGGMLMSISDASSLDGVTVFPGVMIKLYSFE